MQITNQKAFDTSYTIIQYTCSYVINHNMYILHWSADPFFSTWCSLTINPHRVDITKKEKNTVLKSKCDNICCFLYLSYYWLANGYSSWLIEVYPNGTISDFVYYYLLMQRLWKSTSFLVFCFETCCKSAFHGNSIEQHCRHRKRIYTEEKAKCWGKELL